MKRPGPTHLGLLAASMALHGCYRPQPYDARTALDELRRVDPPRAAPVTLDAAAPRGTLDVEEAVATALRDNPELRALRHQRGIAEGQIVAARAVANPTLDLAMLHVQTLGTAPFAWSAELSWEPPMPELFAARGAAARANLDAVKAEIGERELQLAFQVRAAHAQLVSFAEQRRLVEQGLELRRRVRDLVERRVQGGASTRLDLGLAELALAEVERDRDDLSAREIEAGRALAELLGTTRAPQVGGLIPEAPPPPALPDLEDRALAARPLLVAEGARCLQREELVRLEHARRWPWFRFSAAPRYRVNETTANPNDFALGVQLVLPILDRNTGPIQAAEAASDQQRENLRRQVGEVRRQLAAAVDEIALRRAVLTRYRESVLPGIDKHEKALAAAQGGGQLDLVAVLSAQGVILRSRREFADLRLAAHRAWLALERAVGEPVGRDALNGGHAAVDR